MEQTSRVVVYGLTPTLQIQSQQQVFDFDEIQSENIFCLKNNFAPTEQIVSRNVFSLETQGSKGWAFITQQSVLLSQPILYIASWYKEINQETELLETIYNNLLELNTQEIKASVILDMNNHKITNLAAPETDMDAVNKQYVDTKTQILENVYTKQQIDTMQTNLSEQLNNRVQETNNLLESSISTTSDIIWTTKIISDLVSFNNPVVITDNVHCPWLVVVPSTIYDQLYVTINGRQSKILSLNDIFGLQQVEYYVSGWYVPQMDRMYLLNTKGTVKLVSTADFNSFEEETAPDLAVLLNKQIKKSVYQTPTNLTYFVTQDNKVYKLFDNSSLAEIDITPLGSGNIEIYPHLLTDLILFLNTTTHILGYMYDTAGNVIKKTPPSEYTSYKWMHVAMLSCGRMFLHTNGYWGSMTGDVHIIENIVNNVMTSTGKIMSGSLNAIKFIARPNSTIFVVTDTTPKYLNFYPPANMTDGALPIWGDLGSNMLNGMVDSQCYNKYGVGFSIADNKLVC